VQLPRAIVLDIEGTVAPISFVADVMFPYARDNVAAHLEAHYDTPEARADIEAIRKQVCTAQCSRYDPVPAARPCPMRLPGIVVTVCGGFMLAACILPCCACMWHSALCLTE
jgi:hypothetical protein